MDREKFQQKALKQTKQKKYKSAEFLMVKGGRDATEGIGNPAFNMSSPDLSAHQTSKEKVIKHDMLDHTLASHQQKRRLPASTEPKGNECCRNYFDPLTEEEINPRQCRMEVSREGSTDERTKEEDSDSGSPMSPSIISDTYKEPGEANPADIEESERQAQRDIILMANPLLEQDLKFQREGISQDIPMSHLKMDRIQEIAPNQPFPADGSACKGARGTKLGSLTDVTGISMGAREAGCEGAGSQSQQPLQIQIKCIRGLKDKAPHGFYLLRVSLLDRPGSWVLQGWQTEQLKTRTHPVHHGGSFYDVGLYLNESLYVVLPQRKAVKPGCSFLFELVLLHGTHTYVDQVVGWAVFPVHDNYFHIVEGKFKCPLLRGPYDQKLGNFRKVEDFICQDLDHWLCNLYFQVSKLPLYPEDKNNQEICTQPSPAFPVNLMEEAEEVKLGMNNTAGCWEEGAKENTAMKLSPCNFIYKLSMTSNSYSIKLPKLGIGWENSTHTHIGGSLSNKIDPCPTDCDLHLLKEARDLHIKGHRSSTHSVKEKSTVCRPREFEDYLQDTSFLEELEKHRVSVFSSSTVGTSESGEFSKHLYFAWLSLSSELELAQWQSQGFWYIILLMVSLCFLRLYLHYVGQWLLLQAISTPVTKFRFHPHTVDLCYPTSSLRIGDELAVIVLGPLMLNTVIFLLLLIRWGCQLLFSSGLDALSKLIITMGVWTVLDPLAVFIVDIFLGRFTRGDEETPTADAAKLYWMFVNTKQPPILGAVITVIAYILLFIISSLMLYVYCLRLHNDSWILDVLQRIHSEENRFFMPHDLEMSNQELSYIVKRSEQWRGLNSERREVAVYDYICNSHGTKTSVSSCDLQHQISVSALGPGDISSHISVYNVYPSGFHELYRHFLRLPGGAIIEVFGDISALAFVPREVTMAIEEHIRATDTVQGETVATHEEKWKGTIKNRRRLLAPMEG